MTLNAFIGESITEMVKYNFSIKFIKRKKDSKNSSCTFTPPPFSEFVINYYDKERKDDWIYNFIHEYCHFLQWRDEAERWKSYDKYLLSFFDYFDNKNRKTFFTKHIRKIQEIEVDGGLKAFNLIKERKLKVNKKRYFHENNLYILCYDSMVKYRKFVVPYEFTDSIMQYIPQKPLTMEMIENFPHFEKIDLCFKQAYEKEVIDLPPI